MGQSLGMSFGSNTLRGYNSPRRVFIYDRPHAIKKPQPKIEVEVSQTKPKANHNYSNWKTPTYQPPKTLLSDIQQPSKSVVKPTNEIASYFQKNVEPPKPAILTEPVTKSGGLKKRLIPIAMISMAVILFATGVIIALVSLKTNQNVKAQVKVLAKNTSDSEGGANGGLPAEGSKPDVNSYKVAAALPRVITIEKLGIKARTLSLSLDKDDILKAPSNIYDTGWYNGSAKPGEDGAMVIDGHVSGPTQKGVFYNIKNLKAGDVIKVERGDGKTYSYKVTSTATYDADKVDMAKVMTSSVLGKQGLNLITCGGHFNAQTNKFEQRVVVFAVLQ